MALLSNIVGLDIGSHSLKAVEFRQTLRGFEVIALVVAEAIGVEVWAKRDDLLPRARPSDDGQEHRFTVGKNLREPGLAAAGIGVEFANDLDRAARGWDAGQGGDSVLAA